MPDPQSFRSHLRNQAHWLQVETLRLRLDILRILLKANFDSSQPRVASGRPDGGRWTNGGAGETERVVRDHSGEKPWSAYVERRRADGSFVSRTINLRTGSTIFSERPDALTERNTVTLRDGASFTFENTGKTQKIYDGRGTLIASSIWTSNGPVGLPVAQPAASLGSLWRHVGLAGIELYNWWTSIQGIGQTTVIAFAKGAMGEPPLIVTPLSEEEFKKLCPNLSYIQSLTNDVANSLDRSRYESPATYGTAVHMGVKREIDGLNDPNLQTEFSLLKSPVDAPYGSKGSIRIDILERLSEAVACVYDLKTGKARLTDERVKEIFKNVESRFPTIQYVFILEIKPK